MPQKFDIWFVSFLGKFRICFFWAFLLCFWAKVVLLGMKIQIIDMCWEWELSLGDDGADREVGCVGYFRLRYLRRVLG